MLLCLCLLWCECLAKDMRMKEILVFSEALSLVWVAHSLRPIRYCLCSEVLEWNRIVNTFASLSQLHTVHTSSTDPWEERLHIKCDVRNTNVLKTFRWLWIWDGKCGSRFWLWRLLRCCKFRNWWVLHLHYSVPEGVTSSPGLYPHLVQNFVSFGTPHFGHDEKEVAEGKGVVFFLGESGCDGAGTEGVGSGSEYSTVSEIWNKGRWMQGEDD